MTYPKSKGPQRTADIVVRSKPGTVEVDVSCSTHGPIATRAAVLYSALDSATRHLVTYHVADGSMIYLDREYAQS